MLLLFLSNKLNDLRVSLCAVHVHLPRLVALSSSYFLLQTNKLLPLTSHHPQWLRSAENISVFVSSCLRCQHMRHWGSTMHIKKKKKKRCFTVTAVVEPFSKTEGTIIGGVHRRSCSSLHISQTSITSWETPWWGGTGWTCVSAQRESFQTIKAEPGVPKRSVLSRC